MMVSINMLSVKRKIETPVTRATINSATSYGVGWGASFQIPIWHPVLQKWILRLASLPQLKSRKASARCSPFGLFSPFNLATSTLKFLLLHSRDLLLPGHTQLVIFSADLRNGAQDVVSVNSDLLIMYGINMTLDDRDMNMTRIITLVGEATAESYEQVSLKNCSPEHAANYNCIVECVATSWQAVEILKRLLGVRVSQHEDPEWSKIGDAWGGGGGGGGHPLMSKTGI